MSAQIPTRQPSYAEWPTGKPALVVHVMLLFVAWIIVLPAGIFCKMSGRRRVLVDLLFVAIHMAGLTAGVYYRASTPNLYPGSTHGHMGWILTIVIVAKVLFDLVSLVCHRGTDSVAPAMEEDEKETKWISIHTIEVDGDQDQESSEQELFDTASLLQPASDRTLGSGKPWSVNHRFQAANRIVQRTWRTVLMLRRERAFMTTTSWVFQVMGLFLRLVPVLGVATMISGGVVYVGIFRGNQIFNGIAHLRGVIWFFWGVFNVFRWAGLFTEAGWAWNCETADCTKKWRTVEFFESLLIFVFGASDMFTEHITAWGKAWTPMDQAHLMIAIISFAGGLCGLLTESDTFWRLYAGPSSRPDSNDQQLTSSVRAQNPYPALVTLLQGYFISNHEQNTDLGMEMHALAGSLLMLFAMCRLMTYGLLYISPASSTQPSRPLSEILGTFFVMSGSLMFMLCARDVLGLMDMYGVAATVAFSAAAAFSLLAMALSLALFILRVSITRRFD